MTHQVHEHRPGLPAVHAQHSSPLDNARCRLDCRIVVALLSKLLLLDAALVLKGEPSPRVHVAIVHELIKEKSRIEEGFEYDF